MTRQWTAEAEIRSLHRPAPVRLRWATTGRPVTGAGGVLSGDISDVSGKFRGLPVKQLVVLGEPGAGKTVLAILLTLGLLAARTPGDPTPVLLSLTSWNPRRDHPHTWLARRLLEEYPGLGNTRAYGPECRDPPGDRCAGDTGARRLRRYHRACTPTRSTPSTKRSPAVVRS